MVFEGKGVLPVAHVDDYSKTDNVTSGVRYYSNRLNTSFDYEPSPTKADNMVFYHSA